MTAKRLTRSRERGQVLVIVAGGVTALLLLVGLVLDGGIAFFNRRDAQNLADVASLAGTKVVFDSYVDTANVYDQQDVYDAVSGSLANNGCSGSVGVPCTWVAFYERFSGSGPIDNGPVVTGTSGVTIPSFTQGVRVYVNRQPGAFLVRLAGINSWNITAEAIAWAQSATTAPKGKLLPIALHNDVTAYQPGQEYDLTDGKDGPGGFGWLSWNSDNDCGSLEERIRNPNNPAFTMPTWFNSDPGKTNCSGVRDAMENWIDSGETVLIPIYDTTTGTGNSLEYHIIGLAAFVVTSQEQPAVDNIRGYFQAVYPYSDVPAGVTYGPPDPNSTSNYMTLIK
jgi:Flp pilus assembly protein TadG